MQDWLIQPIAVDTVADVLVEVALGQTHAPLTIKGPDVVRLPDMTSKLLARQSDPRRVRAVQPAVSALARGALLASDDAVVLGPDLETCLQTVAPARTSSGPADQPAGSTPDLTHV